MRKVVQLDSSSGSVVAMPEVRFGRLSDWLGEGCGSCTAQRESLRNVSGLTTGYHQLHLPPPDSELDTMASKYAFSAGLKELRFLFCQTSEHSAATRYVRRHKPQHERLRCASARRDGGWELVEREG